MNAELIEKFENLVKKFTISIVLPFAVVISAASPCLANAPPLPSVLIIVPSAPKDLVLTIGSIEPHRIDTGFDSYFGFFLQFDKPSGAADRLQVTEGNNTYEIILPPLKSYSNTFTLDLASKTLMPGASTTRPYEIGAITAIATILIEGIIFYIAGYRKKFSWVVFLISNLFTQGFLYIWLAKISFPFDYAMPVSLIIGEFWVFILEGILFVTLVREGPRVRTILYVLLANLASLILGGIIVSIFIPNTIR